MNRESRPPPEDIVPSDDGVMSALDERVRAKTKVIPVSTKHSDNDIKIDKDCLKEKHNAQSKKQSDNDSKMDKVRPKAQHNTQSNEAKAQSKTRKGTISDLDDKIKAKTMLAPLTKKKSNFDVSAKAAIIRLEGDVLAKPGNRNKKSSHTATPGAVAIPAPYKGKPSGRSALEAEDLRTQTLLSHLTMDKFEKPRHFSTNENIEVGDDQSDEVESSSYPLSDSLPSTTNTQVQVGAPFCGDGAHIGSTGCVRGNHPTASVIPYEIAINNNPRDIEAFVVSPVRDAFDVVRIKTDEELESEAREKYVKKLLFVAFMVVLVAAGVVVLISFATGDSGETKPIPEKLSTSTTNMPSTMPSMAPTTNRYRKSVDILTDASFSDASNLFRKQNVSTRDQLLDKDSPQGKALAWVANEDPMGLEINDPKYIQRYIMAVFYYSMDGPNWLRCSEGAVCSNKAAWLSGDDECNWNGSGCVSGRVSRIDLGNSISNGLKGQFPKEMCHFTEMNFLAVQNNHNIRGTIPACFGKFSKLQYLILTNNQIELPIHTAVLNGWLSLKVLFLGGNELAGKFPESLLKLSTLEELDLSGNDLTGPFPEFDSSAAPLLVDLDLSYNRLQGDIPESLFDISKLDTSNQRS